MREIFKFCKNAKNIKCSTTNINSLNDLVIKIKTDKDEIYRSRWGNNNTCFFNFSLHLKGNETLNDEIKYMQTIEMFYPETFSWRFDGRHIEAIANINIKKEQLGIFTRYKGVLNFISQLRKRLIAVLKFRDYNAELNYKNIYENILSTGSINSKYGCYVIDILPTETAYEILGRSNKNIIVEVEMKIINMKFWVKEINPDFYKEFHNRPKIKKYTITDDIFEKYPDCIKKICEMPKKGNYNRYLLATFFLGVHNERDAKHQLDVVLDDTERHHLNYGNCKDQWRTILIKKYSPPSCKTMIDCNFCNKDCGKAAPIDLEGGEK